MDQRLTALDGLRGCAALSVFFSHVACLLTGASYVAAFHTPLRFLLDGEAAVDLFFVLSGFVLALSLTRGEPQSWGGFLVRRAFRLYPAHWAAFALAWILSGLVLRQHLNAWFADYPERTGTGAVLEQLALLGDRVSMDGVNPVIWTLGIEMQMALAFPLLLRALMGSAAQKTAVLFACVAAGFYLHYWPLPLFALGALLAMDRPAREAGGLRQSVLAGLLLYAVRTWEPALIDQYWGHLLCGLGAALLVAAAAEGRLPLLQRRLPQLLGRLSYGFYLVHLPILLLLVSWMPAAPLLRPAALALVLALAVAALLRRLVELPSLRLGRRLAERLTNALDPDRLRGRA